MGFRGSGPGRTRSAASRHSSAPDRRPLSVSRNHQRELGCDELSRVYPRGECRPLGLGVVELNSGGCGDGRAAVVEPDHGADAGDRDAGQTRRRDAGGPRESQTLPSMDMLLEACTGSVISPHPVLTATEQLARLHLARATEPSVHLSVNDCERTTYVHSVERWVACSMPPPLGAATMHTETLGRVIDRPARFCTDAHTAPSDPNDAAPARRIGSWSNSPTLPTTPHPLPAPATSSARASNRSGCATDGAAHTAAPASRANWPPGPAAMDITVSALRAAQRTRPLLFCASSPLFHQHRRWGHSVIVRTKICGIRSENDVSIAISTGADAVGFICGTTHFTEDGLTRAQARELSELVPPFVERVLVTHLEDPDEIIELAAAVAVDTIQVHGTVTDDTVRRVQENSGGRRIVKAVHVTGSEAVVAAIRTAPYCDAILLDSRTADRLGGTGTVHDWSISAAIVDELDALRVPVVLAGGLNPINVAEAIARVRPFALDVNSGVEIPETGDKDPAACAAFVRAAHDTAF